MNFVKDSYSFLARLGCCALVFAITACSAPKATIQLGGNLNVFSTPGPLDINDLPDDWVTSDTIPQNAIARTVALGLSTISVTSTTQPFLIARRVSVNLLATPYLSWQWRLESGKWEYHPVRIVIGFAGGSSEPIPHSTFSRLFPSSTLPRHDRVMSLMWAPSALMRGSLAPIKPDTSTYKREARYVVRGGPENIGIWWPETVDLAALYKLSWPEDQQSSARVTFIGLSSAPSKTHASAYIKDLRLSR